MKQALFKLVDHCFTSVHHDVDHQLDNSGLDSYTPMTLMHLLLNMRHKILGGSMLISFYTISFIAKIIIIIQLQIKYVRYCVCID